MRDWGIILGGSGLNFRAILGVWAGSGSQVRLGRCSGRLLGGSWSRLGAVLGPKMDPVTSKLLPKLNPIGVLRRLEEPDAFMERLSSFSSSFQHRTRKMMKLPVLVPRNLIIP